MPDYPPGFNPNRRRESIYTPSRLVPVDEEGEDQVETNPATTSRGTRGNPPLISTLRRYIPVTPSDNEDSGEEEEEPESETPEQDNLLSPEQLRRLEMNREYIAGKGKLEYVEVVTLRPDTGDNTQEDEDEDSDHKTQYPDLGFDYTQVNLHSLGPPEWFLGLVEEEMRLFMDDLERLDRGLRPHRPIELLPKIDKTSYLWKVRKGYTILPEEYRKPVSFKTNLIYGAAIGTVAFMIWWYSPSKK